MSCRPALLLVAALALASTAVAESLTVERLFAAPDLQGASLRSLRFSPDGRLVTFLKPRDGDLNALDLWAYDVVRREQRLLVDARSLVDGERTLSAEEEARRERQRIAALRGIVQYEWAPDSKALLFPLDGDLYWYDLRQPPARAVRRLTATAAFETDPKISPRGRYVSFVREQNLYVLDLATGAERRLTPDGSGLVSYGMAEFIAQEEMDRDTGYWWSPDDRHLALTRVDESPVQEVERFEVLADGFTVYRQRYPAAGTANARVALGIVPVEGGDVRWLDLGDDPDVYLARVQWYPEGDRLLVQRQSRDQRTLDLLAFELAGGASRTLLTEQRDTWVELHDDLHFLPRNRQFIWASQRSGHRHLYLYTYDGQLRRTLTAGDWDVEGERKQPGVVAIDEDHGRVFFMATEKTPLERHLYAARLDTRSPAEPLRITRADGWHSIVMGPKARRFVQVYSDPLQPPQVSLHRSNGTGIAWIEENRLGPEHPYARYLDQHVAPEFGTLEAEDGATLYWQLYRPPGFDPAARHPAIVMVYGGPGVQTVQRRWGDRRGGMTAQLLAQQGYVVFALDNRGSGSRGARFADSIHLRMGDVEVRDQRAGVAFLAGLPGVDRERIGVYGWSYGGYLALMLMLKAPETFRAGVAGAPVTDWRLYDTHYTERYLGRPQDQPDAYEAASVLPRVDSLEGRLLIVHGMADDNVLFTHTTAVIDRLTKAGRLFEVLPYPGAKHAALTFAETGRHGWHTILDFFDRTLGGEAAAP